MTPITESVLTLDRSFAEARLTLLGSECFHFKSVSVNKRECALEDSVEGGLFSNLFYSSLGGSSLGAVVWESNNGWIIFLRKQHL